MDYKQALSYVTGVGIKTHPQPQPKDMSWVTMWLSFLSGVNRRASCMLSHYLTNSVYLFEDTFILNGLFSAEFHKTNTRVNVKGSVAHGPE